MRSVAVIGSRGFSLDQVDYFLRHDLRGCERVVSGGARGVDRFAEDYAQKQGLHVLSYRPTERRYWVDTAGPTAGQSGKSFFVDEYVDGEDKGAVCHNGDPLRYASFAEAAKCRNWWIVRDADRVVAFWDGMSSGTAHGIAAATRFGRPLTIHMDGDS